MQSIVFGIFGAILGSFIYASVVRIARKESIVTSKGHTAARSHCDSCQHTLGFFDLIPVLSFLVLRGKCRYCHARIGRGHFFAECLYAVFGVCVGLSDAPVHVQCVVFLYGGVLVFTFFYDLLYFQILDSVMLSSMPIVALLSIVVLHLSWQSLVLGACIGGGFFAIQYIISRGRWIGDGDIRLGIVMGLMLGAPNVVVALFIAYIVGAVWALGLVLTKKASLGARIPFGTFLSLATLVTLLYGGRILDWYLHLLLLS